MAVASFAGLVLAWVAAPDGSLMAGLFREIVVFAVLSGVARTVALALAREARRRGRRDTAVIMGAGEIGNAIATALRDRPELGLTPVGFIDPDPRLDAGQLCGPVVHTDPHDLERVIREYSLGAVIMAFSGARESDLVDAVMTTHRLGCVLYIVPRMFELHPDSPEVERIAGYPLVRIWMDPTTRPTWPVKVLMDRLVAVTLLALASPLIALAAIAVLLESGRPVIFRQTRIGLDGRAFEILKIRSLRPETTHESQTRWSIDGDPRVGPVGRLLRRTAVDELPQLWNIARGEMSFVGPRPERPGFAERFSDEHERYWARHRVPAGLTGLAQVHGLRGDTSISERARYDNLYITNWSIWLDVKILILTVREIVQPGPR